MSIIDKAVDKLEQAEKMSAVSNAPISTRGEALIEMAVTRADTKLASEHKIATTEVDVKAQTAAPEASSRLANINLAKLRLAGMITPDGETTQISEEFRLIKRPLIQNAFNRGAAPVKNGNLIMVTSSFPGEGKSFCAINLAMSIAMERDYTVLLVDADVAKPSIPNYLGIKAEKGLMDLLLDDRLQLSDVLIKTNVEKLTILPAGRGHRYATEFLASDGMSRLLQDMAQRYPERIVIFDSPPLMATSESRVLATHMGQIVMVVEAERTTHEALKEALHQIESCDVIGLLLNKGNTLHGMDYYGSYGGYGK